MRRLLLVLLLAVPVHSARAQDAPWPTGTDALSLAWRKAFSACQADGFTPMGVSADTAMVACAIRSAEVAGRYTSRATLLKPPTGSTAKETPPGTTITITNEAECGQEKVTRLQMTIRTPNGKVIQPPAYETIYVVPGTIMYDEYSFACKKP